MKRPPRREKERKEEEEAKTDEIIVKKYQKNTLERELRNIFQLSPSLSALSL